MMATALTVPTLGSTNQYAMISAETSAQRKKAPAVAAHAALRETLSMAVDVARLAA